MEPQKAWGEYDTAAEWLAMEVAKRRRATGFSESEQLFWLYAHFCLASPHYHFRTDAMQQEMLALIKTQLEPCTNPSNSTPPP